jgi:hypothetical protein
VPSQSINKSPMPSLLEVNEVQDSAVFVENQIESERILAEIEASYGSNGIDKSAPRKSSSCDCGDYCGDWDQEMMEPRKTRGCYYTVETYNNPYHMDRGYATLNQIGLMPHTHADPEIYIVSSNVVFCGLNRDGQYATVNLRPKTLVLINGGATHGIYKNGIYKIEKFINHFYWCFPKPSDCITYF